MIRLEYLKIQKTKSLVRLLLKDPWLLPVLPDLFTKGETITFYHGVEVKLSLLDPPSRHQSEDRWRDGGRLCL